MTILSAIAKEQNRAVLVVTHDTRVLGFAERIIQIEDGSYPRWASGPQGPSQARVRPFGACFRPASRR